jgi:hypothetical protein
MAQSQKHGHGEGLHKKPRAGFGRYKVTLPGTRRSRAVLGIGLCIGGLLGFLPILGFWMLPLGVLVLSVDFHPIRRGRRRFDAWLGRRRGKGSARRAGR